MTGLGDLRHRRANDMSLGAGKPDPATTTSISSGRSAARSRTVVRAELASPSARASSRDRSATCAGGGLSAFSRKRASIAPKNKFEVFPAATSNNYCTPMQS